DTSGGVGVLAVVDGERQEVDAFACAARSACGDEHHGIAETDDHRTAGLLGQLAGLKPERTLADSNFAGSHRAALDGLFPDIEAPNQIAVALRVFCLQVVEQSTPAPDEHEKTAPRVMVLRMRL